ncbi:carbohydrate porin [Nostoc spongiaeforme FACHB-130]|uniref:Carbohydrate porin n=1 Tax=Nostoc spongiaeforme FACHB-130 TaxID=1357510 RepID=A0ABR8FR73_9NOSO|nr:iron uptake porin [Nostoc spongiaeforme]MBD2593336.1 carbohydrate porin [Nostoc spongiaeforme FACHB-130]
MAGLNGGSQIASAQDYTSTETQSSLSLDNQDSSIFPAASIDQGVIENTEPMAQVTSVSQLNDVQPSDWAFTALQSLVERYNCIAGYPNNSFRGDRAVSRYEFAAGMNACLDKINQILAVAAPSAELVTRADLDTIQRLQSEFSSELATLRGRVDSLEARTAELEANQFSTTTKLNGLLIVGVQGRSSNRGDVNPRDGVKDSDDNGTNFNVINFSYLSLTTQLTPRSYLFTGLVAADGTTKPKLSNDFALSYEYPTDNKLTVIDLNYRWLVTDKLAVMVGTEGVNMTNAFRGPVRVESAATGPLSWLAQRNPILDIGFGHGGIAVDWQFAKRASLQALYTSYTPGKPGERSGLFDGTTTTAVQLLLTPTDNVDLSLYYVNNYASDGCLLTFVGDECLTATNAPLQTNAYGGTLSWQISPRFTVGAWGGYTTSSIPGRSGSVETTNYMVFLNFPDLFAQGNLGGIYVGQPPKITSSTLPVGNNVPDFENTGLGRAGGQPGTTTQIEAFYRFRMTDNIYITPGIIHILEPGHTPDSDPVTIGILRSTFLF